MLLLELTNDCVKLIISWVWSPHYLLTLAVVVSANSSMTHLRPWHAPLARGCAPGQSVRARRWAWSLAAQRGHTGQPSLMLSCPPQAPHYCLSSTARSATNKQTIKLNHMYSLLSPIQCSLYNFSYYLSTGQLWGGLQGPEVKLNCAL